jgi:hypothetical protein
VGWVEGVPYARTVVLSSQRYNYPRLPATRRAPAFKSPTKQAPAFTSPQAKHQRRSNGERERYLTLSP